jgi:hypothetical protein
MVDRKLPSSKRRQQIDLDLVKQVVAPALEAGVLFFFDDDDDVAGEDAGALVCLAGKGDALAVLHALVDVDFQDLRQRRGVKKCWLMSCRRPSPSHLALLNNFLPVAVLAPVLFLDHLSLSVTIRARLLQLLNHWSNLPHNNLYPPSRTPRTRLARPVLSALSITPRANDLLLQGEFGDFSAVQVFQGDFEGVGHVFAFSGPGLAAASAAAEDVGAEEMGKEVFGGHAAFAAADAFFSVC